jgi:hypothetical protein
MRAVVSGDVEAERIAWLGNGQRDVEPLENQSANSPDHWRDAFRPCTLLRLHLKDATAFTRALVLPALVVNVGAQAFRRSRRVICVA